MRLLAMVGLAVATVAMAQPVSGGVTPSTRVIVTGAGCPGWLQATQSEIGAGRTLWTIAQEDKDKKHPWTDPGSMTVHVAFVGTRQQPRSLEFSVSYLPAGLRLKDTADGQSSQELKKIYALSGKKTKVEGDLLVGPASVVTRVHLISATFADESVWNAPNDDACSVGAIHVIAGDSKEGSLHW